MPDPIPYEVLRRGKLVFQRIGPSGSGIHGIYVVDIDNQSSWGIGAGASDAPAAAPNGQRIAYTKPSTWEEGTVYDVHVMSIDGSENQNVSHVHGQDRSPSWTADSEAILFYAEGFEQGFNVPLYRQSPVADPPDRVLIRTFSRTGDPCPYGPVSVSTLGKLVFATSGAVHSMDLDGSNMTAVTAEPESWCNFRSPAWAPDGGKIAYLCVHGDSTCSYRSLDIILMNADGSNPTSLAMFETDGYDAIWAGTNDISLCWSPDGSMIAFNKKQAYLTSHIYVINTDGSGLTQVTSAEGVTDRSLTWSD